MTNRRFRYSLWQDGIEVAAVDCPTIEAAQREIMHYAMMYSQDGECEIRGKNIEAFRQTFKAATTDNGELPNKKAAPKDGPNR